MKDKEKQIEEMAKISARRDDTCRAASIANALYNAGYRKIPEDSVVLTQDEVYEFRKDQAEVKFLKKRIQEQTRKETAREIYRELCGHGTTYVKKWIKERFGMEIEGVDGESENERLKNVLEIHKIELARCAERLEKAEHDRDRYKARIDEIQRDYVVKAYDKLRAENKKLKDRIAELEKVYSRQVRIINNLNIEVVKEQEKLKQFAERLKEKYGKSCSEYYPELIELTSEQLDETLKEFDDNDL